MDDSTSTPTGYAEASSPLETAQTTQRSCVTMRSGASSAIRSESTVYSDSPSRPDARTASFVAGSATTFPLYLFSQLRFPSLLPQVIAVAVIVFVVSMVVILATEVGRRFVERKLDIELAAAPPEALAE